MDCGQENDFFKWGKWNNNKEYNLTENSSQAAWFERKNKELNWFILFFKQDITYYSKLGNENSLLVHYNLYRCMK